MQSISQQPCLHLVLIYPLSCMVLQLNKSITWFAKEWTCSVLDRRIFRSAVDGNVLGSDHVLVKLTFRLRSSSAKLGQTVKQFDVANL